ncbi:MAG: IS66 family transposase [Oscillospiraceae bacterium]|nr:IS66 family transposase [Oscillospiraceae bacterium]
MPPARCQYWNRCAKYTDLAVRIDRLTETLAAKDRRIRALEEENARLKDAQCGGASGAAAPALPFKSGTPSSKIPVKPNSSEEDRRRVGGRPKGHAGHGRKAVPDEAADEVVELARPTSCPVHGVALASWTTRTRTVVHMVPARRIVRNYTIYRAWCPLCGKYHESDVPGVMPYFAFTNDLISQVLVDHFQAGIPLGTLARRAGVKKAALKKMAHKVAELLEGGVPRLVEEFRAALDKHADETPWSCDGKNGYAWGFFTSDVSVYRLRGTRASTVPAEIFGDGAHAGVLGVDRYSAYNCSWRGRIQYCLEHFKRNVRDLLEAEPKNAEYQKHIPRFLELLASAMTLRNRKRGREYDDESLAIRDELLAIARSPVRDGKLRGYFDLMVQKRERFFQWVCHPEIEAENNLAERRLRPLVIARKVCFGSQSEKGLKTRETLMTIIDTLSLRCDDPVAKLSQVLYAIGRDRKSDVAELLWGPKPTAPEAANA